MFSQISFKKICVMGMASSLILIASAAQSAKAVVLDSNVYSQYSAVRGRLLVKETAMLKDYDDLRKQLDELQRANNDKSLTPTIDGLSRSIDDKFQDIRRLQQDIKALDLKML